MGLLDGFLKLSPEQNQGLMAAAAQMLQASGPSLMPRSFGQIAGGGMQAYQQAEAEARQRAMWEQQAGQMSQMRGMQIEQMQGAIEAQRGEQERQARIAERLRGGGQPGPEAPQMMASAAPGGENSPKIGGPDWLQAYQQQNGLDIRAPGSQSGKPNATKAYVQRLMNEAEIYAAEGDFDGADKRYQAAVKLMPQVDRIEIATDPNTQKPVRVITYKDGTEEVSAYGAKPDMKEIALGDKKVFRDLNTVQNGETFQMGYSPSDRVSMRNQNMADARQRDANNIAAGQKVITASTGLRQEFHGLPEVKSYKQAVPAYKAIEDAVKRNTAQADINIVYGIAKIYDPDSAVREGEYATVANSPNIPERIKGWAQHLAGGGRLTEKVKQELLAEATSRMRSFEQPYLAARQSYTTISQNSGADPSLLFPAEHKSPIQAPERKVATLSDIAATAKASGRSTAEVTAALRAKGYTIGGQ